MNNLNFASGVGVADWIHVFGPVLLLLALWTIFWKGLALWHAAKAKQPVWFVVLLLVNTVGILEIVYLFAILKLKKKDLFHK